MKYLYNKIYEAINAGIQKALVLDDEDDVSMNYQHKKIVNNSNLMPYYVNELLQGSDIEYNYEQIIKYYEETEYIYKVKDFIELKNIFNKIKNIENVSFEWISNMKDYVSIVLEDKSEINFYEKTDKNSLFLRLANDDILNTENEILIYIHDDHYIPKKEYQWQTKEVQIQLDEYIINIINNVKYGNQINAKRAAEKDYSGYETCLKIQDIVQENPKKYGKCPAINYCLNLNDINGYQGYLPSMGQLIIMYDNIDLIKYILYYLYLNGIEDLNISGIEDLNVSYWWSSTEYSNNRTWILNFGSTYGNFKDESIRIFPLFAIKK
ncbi:MAG: hypothetical protein [Wendovervirus sonii]|uniref:DUF1566 domain-containing protein n=1 Tax=phage Lak_Megaphage_Sonny TaxID=3109229 RepID=A0ABZ0Z425_9CAUD|nr:MAG: hypothetical protein [phage Lak_Megaphage_Sonny]